MFTTPSKVVLYLHKKQQPITDHSSFHIDAVLMYMHNSKQNMTTRLATNCNA